jgi:5-methylcytosine-specific restriction endonuclease McrA
MEVASMEAKKAKECQFSKDYYVANREQRLAQSRQYQQDHKAEIAARKKVRYYETHEARLASMMEYKNKNREELNRKARERGPRKPEYHRRQKERYQEQREANLVRMREYGQKNKEQLARKAKERHVLNQDRNNTRSAVWRRQNPELSRLLSYKCSGAPGRGLVWQLSDEHATTLFGQACHYCHALPAPLNGIDRKDNKIGYVVENVVPCCWPCNNQKKSMAYDAFVALKLREKKTQQQQ